MIVPMKKVSLIIRENKKNETLKKLRKLGIVHIEITEGSGERLASLQEQIALLETIAFTIGKQIYQKARIKAFLNLIYNIKVVSYHKITLALRFICPNC